MRITGGQFRGRAIATLPGKGTRPSTDRTREGLFNILQHVDWAPELDGCRIIDLFAGSGALGFEAVSRGASFALFVEAASSARGVIRQNVETFSLFGCTRIHRRSATDLGPKPNGLGDPFDIAFLDPPYDKGLVEPALQQLIRGDWLNANALCIVETRATEEVEPDGWDVIDNRIYGNSRLSFLKRV